MTHKAPAKKSEAALYEKLNGDGNPAIRVGHDQTTRQAGKDDGS
jgi:hypothetical protein